MMAKTAFLLLAFIALRPTICPAQRSDGRQVMELAKLYERAQDSAFLPGNNVRRVAFLIESNEKGRAVWGNLTEIDSASRQSADYLQTALTIYATVAEADFLEKDTARARLFALQKRVNAFGPSGFPLRFSVLGNTVSIQFKDVAPDLRLFYSTLLPFCSCREKRGLANHLDSIGEKELSKTARRRVCFLLKKCNCLGRACNGRL